ncbi:hypothetical protein H112_01067 [Trichophyton rubrum D6]|uniref:Uncharacterized protein n=3 Tax=Trichophyton TaxID=5550 RepID=A0A080WPD0_TRIRC|nr:uncharacterized protein TERG_12555 [Trichophyton rubrum CBS 118892]EZF26888.1 hypothetical protein H100_01067 [Trichophyton rubrum MR850]EZF45885.1 hypothetical protein H102_01057 [Trichophyton rubrum CBS 100081]EZF56560.1 hypothetical protein H103_01065 [Trichophyton rubrum CBS 288.86]EZF67186.1 hypothetical protein H104_01050 [Trichophyton rubrum CBS 289.86]EZF77788.1 hypothetical protein H105_01069 [Trichophyton soudanense CBS 452.61]EZF88465.1 hypothetical protein H110_01067 [Trichophy
MGGLPTQQSTYSHPCRRCTELSAFRDVLHICCWVTTEYELGYGVLCALNCLRLGGYLDSMLLLLATCCCTNSPDLVSCFLLFLSFYNFHYFFLNPLNFYFLVASHH